jgi:hypothetical protein
MAYFRPIRNVKDFGGSVNVSPEKGQESICGHGNGLAGERIPEDLIKIAHKRHNVA